LANNLENDSFELTSNIINTDTSFDNLKKVDPLATGYGEKATRVNFTSTVTVKVFCHTESNSICGCAQPTFPGTLSRTVK